MKQKVSVYGKGAYYLICLFTFCLISCIKEKSRELAEVPTNKKLEYLFKSDIQSCIMHLDSIKDLNNKEQILNQYLKSRSYFKRAEPILAFVEKDNYKSLNQPNFLKVDEEDPTDIKKKKPFGYQVIEELIFEEPIPIDQIHQIAKLTKDRLKLILNNSPLKIKEYHALWILRDAVVRVALTGTTGFDSPILENSLNESMLVYQRIEEIIDIYEHSFSERKLYRDWQNEIKQTIKSLESDFNNFNRYAFIKKHTHLQLKLLVKTQEDWKVNFPFELALKNKAISLFSNNTFNKAYFSENKKKPKFIEYKEELGEQLFNDKRLSKSNDMSCATCHQKSFAFTDGLTTFPQQKRNSPTLLYASLQNDFFYDSRAGSLEGQIVGVINNENEFHSNLKEFTEVVANDKSYVEQFEKLYGGKLNDNNIRNAIATYIRSLNYFNSKFDSNINGKEETLTKSEIKGFNLFMGKAKCATCHFPPTFNGTVPPNFTDTELESIGVPNDKEGKQGIDDDLGRFNLFGTTERKHFFKTPTIRNITKTAPYMHNGIYDNLKEVMDFYNNGGGNGLGFELEHQTLPADSLHLNKQEIEDIISFMNTLEDKY